MGSDPPRVLEFIESLETASTVDGAWGLFMSFARQFGFTGGGLADMPSRSQKIEETTLCLSWPEGWRQRYFTQNYVVNDPAQLHLGRTADPYTWEEMLQCPYYNRQQRRIVDEASEFALTTGFIVPILGLTAGRAMVTIAGTKVDLALKRRAELHLAAIYAHARIRALATAGRAMKTRQPLAPRERECLQWVAAGKSDWEISEILSISENTANTHIERAKQKFGVATRMQAVVQALRAGEITF